LEIIIRLDDPDIPEWRGTENKLDFGYNIEKKSSSNQ
jgi:hypothetical protein